jgi:hypothetical protein
MFHSKYFHESGERVRGTKKLDFHESEERVDFIFFSSDFTLLHTHYLTCERDKIGKARDHENVKRIDKCYCQRTYKNVLLKME